MSTPAYQLQTPHRVVIPGPFGLESGEVLPRIEVAYETWGRLDAEAGNAVLVVHALTGSSHACSDGDPEGDRGWWDCLIGRDCAVDSDRHFIVCANLLGSCYGTTGPASQDPTYEGAYGVTFPEVTTRDMARVLKALLDRLGIQRLELVIGGSLGAMMVWQLVVDYPELAVRAMPIAGGPQASAWVIALNHVAREAIRRDPEWREGAYDGPGPRSGLGLARKIAMISYRTAGQLEGRFGRQLVGPTRRHPPDADVRFEVESYLQHHGDGLVDRFDARSYMALTRAMDSHDVSRGIGSLDAALARIQADVTVVAIDSDVLFPASELAVVVSRLQRVGGRADLRYLRSEYGHDGFLVEHAQLSAILRQVLEGSAVCVC